MHEQIINKLYETFPLKERQGTGGMQFKYVPNEEVIHRMNTVFAGNWSTEVLFRDVVDDYVVMEVAVIISDPETKEYFKQTGYGSSQIQRYSSGPNQGKAIDIGNAYKGALSKGIVNACTRWGVGLFKEYNPLTESVPQAKSDQATTVAAPPMPEPPPAPPAQPTTVPPAPNVPSVPQPQNSAPTPPAPPVPQNATPAPPAPPTPANTPPAPPAAPTNLPPGVPPTVSASTVVQTEPTNAAPPAPPEPAPQAPPSPQPQAVPNFPGPNMDAPSAPDLPFSGQDGNSMITDVQRVALNGILSMRNVDYNDLAKEAFEFNGINKVVPNKENLTYEDAVIVIKYGNDKYRKR